MAQDLNKCYRVLGVDEKAGPEEIKAAFRRIAKVVHPDTNPNDPKAQDKFRELQRSYEYVMAMAHYYQAAGARFQNNPKPTEDVAVDWKMNDVSDHNLDVVYSVDVGLKKDTKEDLIRRAYIPHKHDSSCKACHGTGVHKNWSWDRMGFAVTRCEKCKGKGKVETVKTLKITIPANAKPGTKLRLTGRGRLDMGTGRRGDLLLNIAATNYHPASAV